jgi:hypothetical protein
MKFRLTLSKSITIDTDEQTPKLGGVWAEQLLEVLRDDDPNAQIDTSSVDEQTGAIVQLIEDDTEAALADLEILPTDIKVEILDANGEPK